MSALTVAPSASSEAGEAQFIARRLADDYRARVNYLKVKHDLSAAEAVARADESCPLGRQWKILDCPAEEVKWSDLADLARSSPERAADRWDEIKEAARNELRSGLRAAVVVRGHDTTAWYPARFLAIRAELTDGWQPRNEVERQLIDQMAMAQAGVYHWTEQLMLGHGVDEAAGAMADRFGRMFTRLLRALCKLRKVPLAVVVQHAAQVNVGGQQVNVSEAGGSMSRRQGAPGRSR